MPDPVAVPPEILARMADTMAEGVTVARDTRTALDQLGREFASLRQHHAEHAAREEPALAAHHDYLRRLADADSAAAVDAKAAAAEERTSQDRARAALRDTLVKILIGLGGILAAAGGLTSLLGGGTHAP